MTPQTEQMLNVAQAYCGLIEQAAVKKPPSRWLTDVAALLPRINAAVAALQDDLRPERWDDQDLDARFDLYARLHELLGELDAYWLEFDALGDEACRSGSLADDLTDIYCELKSGLELAGAAPEKAADGTEQAVANWRTGYLKHWGRHVIDAQRHLMDLDVLR